MPQNNSKSNVPKKKFDPRDNSFLESLRSIGSGTVSSAKNDLVKPGVRDIFDSFSPFKSTPSGDSREFPKDPFANERFWEEKYKKLQRQHEVVGREEKVIFTRQERETQTQVKNLQDEIRKLATSTGELAREVQVATMQEEVNPGTYHLNFLQRLSLVIKNLRTQVQESSSWLACFNKKSKKKNGYWNQFKKSGSSFSLHHDRSVATQAG